jgi:hypothetical protein
MDRYMNQTQLGDDAKKLLLYCGLSRELRDAIANADEVPDEYTEWVTWLGKKDRRLAARRQESSDY